MVDECMLYDDMQYTRRDWRNRNQIKTPQGLVWLSIPVEVSGKYFQKINETRVSDKQWNTRHWDILKQNYSKAACYKEVKYFVEGLYRNVASENLSEINLYFLKAIAGFLGIATPITSSSDYTLVEGKTEKLVDLCVQRGATDYYSGPAAKNYIDENKFLEKNIRVHWIDYSNYDEYTQLHPPFVHEVSILDLIFNEGKNAAKFLKNTHTIQNG